MQSTTTAETWKDRVDRLGLTALLLSRVTGVAVRTVRAYRQGTRTPPVSWLAKVDDFLTRVENAVAPNEEVA